MQQLPIQIIPRVVQRIGFMVGALITLVMSCVLAINVLPELLGIQHSVGRIAWLLIALSAAVFLGSLVGLTVGLINLFGGSPLQHLIIDRQGITYRKFLGTQRFSWKDLGPFQAIQSRAFRPRHTQQRYWIVADTLGAIEGGDTGWWPLSRSASLRIPADTYLWPGVLVGSMAPVAEDAAGWLEQLRHLARNDWFDGEDIPNPPAAFRTPSAIGSPFDMNARRDSSKPLHSFGKRRKPVIER
jgi:hypothetical protein